MITMTIFKHVVSELLEIHLTQDYGKFQVVQINNRDTKNLASNWGTLVLFESRSQYMAANNFEYWINRLSKVG